MQVFDLLVMHPPRWTNPINTHIRICFLYDRFLSELNHSSKVVYIFSLNYEKNFYYFICKLSNLISVDCTSYSTRNNIRLRERYVLTNLTIHIFLYIINYILFSTLNIHFKIHFFAFGNRPMVLIHQVLIKILSVWYCDINLY